MIQSAFTRRATLMLGASTLALAAMPAWAQRRATGPETVPVDELMKAGSLPELSIGKVEAPVIVVEYASKTCGHCAAFHNKIYPGIKEKFIDSGKVRFIYREFPLDDRAMAADMLARCTGTPEKALAMTSILFAKQEEWAFVRTNPVTELFKIAKQAGFTQESFDKCLTDQKLLDEITTVRERGTKTFGVSATPTFFVNGKRTTSEGLEKEIVAALPKS